MKYIVVIMLLLITSCSQEKEANIKGKWYLYSTTSEGITKKVNYQSSIELDGCYKKHFIEFKENTFKQVKIGFHECLPEDTTLGTYQINNEKISLLPQSAIVFDGKAHPINEDKKLIKGTVKVEKDKLILEINNSVFVHTRQ